MQELSFSEQIDLLFALVSDSAFHFNIAYCQWANGKRDRHPNACTILLKRHLKELRLTLYE